MHYELPKICTLVPELAPTSCYPGGTFYMVETHCKAALHHQTVLGEIKLENCMLKYNFLKIFHSNSRVSNFQRELTEPNKIASCCKHLQTKLKFKATILKYYCGILLLNIKHLKFIERGAEGRILCRDPLFANRCFVYTGEKVTSRT